MADTLGTAVLTLTTDSAQVIQGLKQVEGSIKSVAATSEAAGQAGSADWATIGKAINAVAKQMADQKAATDDLKSHSASLNEAFGEMKSLATEVAGALGIAFTIDSAVEFLKSTIENAAALKNLSDQTEISIEDLQVLSAATSDYGVNSDELGRALYQLRQRIAGGDDSVVAAYAAMGLKIEDIKNLDAYTLFVATERGLGTLQGAIRDTAAADLYGGKLGSSLTALSTHIDEAIDHAKQFNTVASTDSVKAAAEYAKAIDQATNSFKAFATEVVGGAAIGVNTLTDAAAKGASKWSIFVAMVQDWAASSTVTGASTIHLATLLDQLNQKTQHNRDITLEAANAHAQVKQQLDVEGQAGVFMATMRANAVKPLTDWQQKDLDQLNQMGQLTAKNAELIGVNAAQFDKYKAGLDVLTKYGDAWTNLNSLGQSYQATLDGLEPTLRDTVLYYAQQGASVQDLVAAFTDLETQLPRVTQGQAQAAVDLVKAQQNAAGTATKLWDDYYQTIAQQSGIGADAQIAAVTKWYNAEYTAIAKLAQQNADAWGALNALNADYFAKLQGALVSFSDVAATSSETWRANLQATADRAAATYQYMVEHAEQFRADTIAKFQAIAADAQIAADSWYTSWSDHLDQIDQQVTATKGAFDSLNQSAQQASSFALSPGMLPTLESLQSAAQRPGSFLGFSLGTLQPGMSISGIDPSFWTGLLPGRASGGPVSAGMPYIVGEHGPEIRTFSRDGAIVPIGAGAGIAINLTVTGGVITDPLGFQRAVKKAVEDGLRGSGTRIQG